MKKNELTLEYLQAVINAFQNLTSNLGIQTDRMPETPEEYLQVLTDGEELPAVIADGLEVVYMDYDGSIYAYDGENDKWYQVTSLPHAPSWRKVTLEEVSTLTLKSLGLDESDEE